MANMKNLLLIAAGFFVISFQSLYSQVVERDIIYLKSGKRVYGVITQIDSSGIITIRSSTGKTLTYSFSETNRIEKENKEAIESGRKAPESQTNKHTFSVSGSLQYSFMRARDEFTRYYYSGGVSYPQTYLKDYNYDHLIASITTGIFIIDNLSANFTVNLESIQSDYDDYSHMTIGASAAYYIGTGASKPFCFLGFNIVDIDGNGQTSYNIGGGYSFAIAKNAAIQPLAQYNYYKIDGNNDTGILQAFSFGVGVQTFIF